MTYLTIVKKEVRSGGILRMAFFVRDNTGAQRSQYFPSRNLARKAAEELAAKYSDVEVL